MALLKGAIIVSLAILALRPEMTLETFLGNRLACLANGYRLFGLFEQNTVVAVSGITIRPHLEFGKQMEIEDFATNQAILCTQP